MDNLLINIIVADDHNIFRKGIIKILHDFPFINEIYPAENGCEVLCILGDINKKPSLILLDLKMPQLTGLEVVDIVKEKYPFIKIVILSMINQQEYIKQLMEKGVDGYLHKDCTVDELRGVLEKALN